MRKKSPKIEPSKRSRPAPESSPFSARLIVVALCLTVCAVPLAYLPGIFEYALLPKRFALHLCVALTCLGWLIQTRWGRRVHLVSSPLLLPAFCWMAVAALSAPATTHPLDTAVEWLNQAVLIALFLVVANTLSLQALQPVLWSNALTGLAVALLGILQYHGLDLLGIPSSAPPSATFGNRNFAAMYLICAIPLSGLLFLTARRRAALLLSGLSATLMGVFLVYTRTRSAWIGVAVACLCVGGLLIFWPGFRRPVWEAIGSYTDRLKWRMSAGLFALFLALSFLPAHRSGLPESKTAAITTAASVFQRGTVEEAGMKYRLAAWAGTLRLVADHPLLGVGPGGWIRAYPPYDRGTTTLANAYMNSPHNDYLWMASEYGLVGLGVYGWFLIAGLSGLLRMARRSETSPRIVALMFALSLLSTLGDAFFNFPREQPQAALFPYLLLGFVAGATADERGRPSVPGSPRVGDATSRERLVGWAAYRGIAFRLVPYLLLLVSLTAFELSRRQIGFDRHYLRAMSSAANPENGSHVLSEVQRALTYGTFQPHILNLKGNAFKNLKRYADAEAAYRQALAYAPHSWHAHNGLCAVALQQGRLEESLTHGRAALSLCPLYTEARNNLGLVLKAKGDLNGAIEEFRKAIGLNPGFAEAYSNLGGALKVGGDLDGAIQAYRKAIGLNPGLAEAHYNLGGALARKEDPDGAIQAYRKAIHLNPGFAEAHYNLGLLLKAGGDLDGAIQAYRKAIHLNPGFAEAHNNLGGALARKGDLDGAIQAYRKAIDLNPGLAEARYNLDLLLKAKKDPTAVHEAFQPASAGQRTR